MKRRTKIITLSSAGLAIAVLAVMAFASSGWIVDRYWIWMLEHGKPADRDRAVVALAERGSPDGLPYLLGRLTQVFGNAEPGTEGPCTSEELGKIQQVR